MELDDFKTAWASMDARLTDLESLIRSNHVASRAVAMRSPLRWLGLGQLIQMVIWILVIGVAAPFWVQHRVVPHLLIAGLLLHVYGVLVVASSVMQLLLVGQLYHTAPVLQFQKRVAELRRFRIINTLALGLPWLVLWVPAMMIGAMKWLGADIYAGAPVWIWSNVAFGVAAIAACVWTARRLSLRPVQSRFVKQLLDDVAGRSINRISRELDEIAGLLK